MKNIIFWAQIITGCSALLFAAVGMIAVDELFVNNWASIAPQKVSLLSGLAGVFGFCGLIATFGSLIERMSDDMRYDPEADEEQSFFDSPRKPR